ncbi:hypothetical protein BDV93DRAFT_406980, partial [Ceratobasidium sp. AG-I]
IHAPSVCRKPVKPHEGQPVRVPEDQQPIVGYYRIGEVLTHVMFDSGSGTNMISADFVQAAKLPPIRQEQPVGLQLVLKGSRGSLNYGVNAPLEVGGVATKTYFDVAGIDKYDAILGTPFLRHHQAKIDFGNASITIGGKTYPS